MDIQKMVDGNTATLIPEGWLDTQNAPEMQTALDSLGEDVQALVIDLSKLEYISSAGLRVIVAAHKKMNGALTVLNPSAEVLDIFRMTGFDKRLTIR